MEPSVVVKLNIPVCGDEVPQPTMTLLIVNVTALEMPPPGGLTTVTLAVPTVLMSAAGTCAVNFEALTYVVGTVALFHSTTEVAMKLLPLTVSVKAAPPTVALVGDSDVATGTGLTLSMVNVTAAEVPPPGVGLTMVTLAVPAVLMSAAGTCAVNIEALTYVVGRAAPFHSTTEEPMKLLPLTVSVKAVPPAVALAGDSDVATGRGLTLLMVNVTAPEVPPPGVGLMTVTLAVPMVLMADAATWAVSFALLT
jgi:hypothetical protein